MADKTFRRLREDCIFIENPIHTFFYQPDFFAKSFEINSTRMSRPFQTVALLNIRRQTAVKAEVIAV